MGKFDDFELDVQVQQAGVEDDTKITSASLCTPGCPTGAIACLTQSCISCNSCILC